jgi:light-harvesting complex II chlorophyll a/b binding protein 7
VAEVKHGRLAMLAMAGYAAQAATTRRGPLQNLLDWASDPAHNNMVGFLTGTATAPPGSWWPVQQS